MSESQSKQTVGNLLSYAMLAISIGFLILVVGFGLSTLNHNAIQKDKLDAFIHYQTDHHYPYMGIYLPVRITHKRIAGFPGNHRAKISFIAKPGSKRDEALEKLATSGYLTESGAMLYRDSKGRLHQAGEQVPQNVTVMRRHLYWIKPSLHKMLRIDPNTGTVKFPYLVPTISQHERSTSHPTRNGMLIKATMRPLLGNLAAKALVTLSGSKDGFKYSSGDKVTFLCHFKSKHTLKSCRDINN